MAVINDRKTVVAQNNGMATVYDPTFLSAGFYYPFGMEMPGLTYTAPLADYRYGFNGKEKDPAFGLLHYDYGFRIYHPGLGRFLSVDPLAGNFPSWTPYHYVHNNPLRFIDPTGMSADDIIDVDLDTKKITITEAEGDDVVRIVEDGEVKATHTYGENGSFKSDNSIHDGKTSNGTGFSYIKMNNDDKATELFEFVSQNSKIEWSQIKYGTKSNYLSTSYKKHSEPGGVKLIYDLTVGKYTVREHIHSHPTSTTGPSGYHPSHKEGQDADKRYANWINKFNPSVQLKVYEVKTKKYIEFDEEGIKE